MNKADEKRTAYYLIPASGPDLGLDPDDPQWLCQEVSPDLLRQLDAVLEVLDDAGIFHLSSQMTALGAYLDKPYALFPGERDSQGIDVTECPFD